MTNEEFLQMVKQMNEAPGTEALHARIERLEAALRLADAVLRLSRLEQIGSCTFRLLRNSAQKRIDAALAPQEEIK